MGDTLQRRLRIPAALSIGWCAGIAAYAAFARAAGTGGVWEPSAWTMAVWTPVPTLVFGLIFVPLALHLQKRSPVRLGRPSWCAVGALLGAVPAVVFVIAMGGRVIDLLSLVGAACWLLFAIVGAALGLAIPATRGRGA